MKQVRFLLAALLLMVCGIMAHAQKVVVYKHDGTKVEYASSDVKDVKYKKVFYYYAGWTCPKNLTELANLAVSPNGGQLTSFGSSESVVYDYTANPLENDDYQNWYVVIPIDYMKVCDAIGTNISSDFHVYKDVTWNGVKYRIITSDDADFTLNTIIIKVK